MVLFNYTTKEMTAKIVYYGPGLCGKTSNLQFIYDSLPSHVKKGKMLSLATKTDRTLFFDFLPIELGRIRGMRTRVQLYTVPGQVFYNSTRKLVLKGADGIVFVADSQQKMMDSNIESYKNLEDNLREIGIRLEEIPIVMQFNKRDLPHLASIEEMNTLINRHNAPFYEAVATTGIGVEDTLKAITKLVLNHLASKYQLEMPSTSPMAGAPSPPSGSSARSVPSPHLAGEERAGINVADETGEMEIERSAPPARGTAPGQPERPFSAAGGMAPGDKMEEGLESLGSLEDGPTPPSLGATHRELEEESITLPAEEEGTGASLSSLMPMPGPPPSGGEDLSELLQEIPDEAGEDTLAIFSGKDKASLSGPSRRAPQAPPGPRVRVATEPQAQSTPAHAVATRSSSLRSDAVISPLDPLGIGGAREGETPLAKAIQVGAVSPGKEHRITVPLEMTVGGRRVRLNLKMTLTVSD